MVRSAEEEYDYEEEPAAPVTPAPARSNSGRLGGLLSSRGRVNVGRKSSAPVSCDSFGTNHRTEPINVLCLSLQAQSTTAKAVEQPVEVEEEGDEEFDDNQDQQEEIPTTTTESSKKVRGGVRPFR